MQHRSLLTYAKLSENHIKDVFHVDPAKQPSQGTNSYPQVLCREFLALLYYRNAPPQRNRRLWWQLTLPLAPYQTALPQTKITSSKVHQRGDQWLYPVAATGRY